MKAAIFRPTLTLSARPTQIMMRVDAAEKQKIKAAATKWNFSLEEFCRQALRFAIENMATPS